MSKSTCVTSILTCKDRFKYFILIIHGIRHKVILLLVIQISQIYKTGCTYFEFKYLLLYTPSIFTFFVYTNITEVIHVRGFKAHASQF